MDFRFRHAFSGKVLAEHSPRQFHVRQFSFPKVVMFGGVGVNGFFRSTVNSQIRLAVTVEIQSAEHDSSGKGFFEDASRNRFTVPYHELRSSNVDRDDFHAVNLDRSEEHTSELQSRFG